MDNFGVVMVTFLAAGSYLLGRWSTQGASWESAFKKTNEACNTWRQLATDWEALAHQWQDAYTKLADDIKLVLDMDNKSVID